MSTAEQIVDQAAHQQLLAEVAELREWQKQVALALGMADEVYGQVHMAKLDDIVEACRDLRSMENEHIECPQWCDECERFEAWQSCTHCNGTGCDAAACAKSGAYAECEWCAGSGREHIDTFEAAARVAEGGER